MTPQPVGRIRFMDRQRVNLDGFAVENPELGLTALRSPNDPEPSLVVTGGRAPPCARRTTRSPAWS